MADPFKNQYQHQQLQHNQLHPRQPFNANERALLLNDPLKQQLYSQPNQEANKESIVQLKSNVDLVFRGLNFGGQFVLYPIRVLKWQCQIHSESQRYHLTPFTIIPVIFNLKNQGYSPLWRGCFSFGAFCAVTNTIENIIGEVTPFEKQQIGRSSKIHNTIINKLDFMFTNHQCLGLISKLCIKSGILNDVLGVQDLLKETWNRITGYKYNYRTRLIPFWSLILPTSLYFVSHQVTAFCFESICRQIIVYLHKSFNDRRRIQLVDEVEEEVVESPYINAISTLCGQLAATLVLYPFETVLNRLIVQGTRTIIDNTDNGYGVIPINTRYDGFIDCLRTIEHTEGVFGFYKGAGLVVLELLFNLALLKFGKFAGYYLYDALWISKNDKSNFEFLTQQDCNSQTSLST